MVSNAKNRFKKSLTRIFLDAPKLGVKWTFVREVKPLTDEQDFYDKFFYNKFTLASACVCTTIFYDKFVFDKFIRCCLPP